MDLVLYKGTLQNSEVSFGLMKSKKSLAFEKDGKYLFPRDKQKQIIELSDDVDYKGYWESVGYSNSGDLDESFIE